MRQLIAICTFRQISGGNADPVETLGDLGDNASDSTEIRIEAASAFSKIASSMVKRLSAL